MHLFLETRAGRCLLVFLALLALPAVSAIDPTVDITANGSNGPVTVATGATPTIAWSSGNAASCAVTKNGSTWASGMSGSQVSEPITSSITFTVTCTGTPDADLPWDAHTPGGSTAASWVAIASSADGMSLAAVDDYTGYVYTSSDGGETWAQRTSLGVQNFDYHNIASSADGSRLLVSTNFGITPAGYLYTSVDGGANWTERTSAGGRHWHGVASSASGLRLAAVASTYPANGPDYIYYSQDGGATWASKASQQYWKTVAMSGDGMKLAAVASSPFGYIYTSTDGGASWVARAPGGLSNGTSDAAWSSDGSALAAIGGWTDSTGAYIYLSTDNGATWTNSTASIGKHYFKSVSMSSDGTTIVATSNNDYVYVSLDGGATWAPQTGLPRTNWFLGSAVSADGTRLVVTRGVGGASAYIYTTNSGDATGGGSATDSVVVNASADGSCGPAASNSPYASGATSYSGAFCSTGSASPASPGFPAQGGIASWICSGQNGGLSTECYASRFPVTMNGVCGPAATNSPYPYDATAFIGAFCGAGNPNPSSPPFPDNGSSSPWLCEAGALSYAPTGLWLNGMTSFYNQEVVVTNNTGAAVSGVRLVLDRIDVPNPSTTVALTNPSGTDGSGKKFLQLNYPVAAGQSVSFHPVYRVLSGPTLFTPVYSGASIVAPLAEPALPAGSAEITKTVTWYPQDLGIFPPRREPFNRLVFSTVAGNQYGVKYSDDGGVAWHAAFGSPGSSFAAVDAGGGVQVLDFGPPLTKSSPTASRQYKVFGFTSGTSPAPSPSQVIPAGTSASCTATRLSAPLAGVCGPAADNSPYAFNEAAFVGAFCSVGSASPASPPFPPLGGTTLWSCGVVGGTSASCAAVRDAGPVAGVCGVADGVYTFDATVFRGPDDFCSEGDAPPVSPAFPAEGGVTNWSCLGRGGGADASCSASRDSAPTVGVCGDAQRNSPYAFDETGYVGAFCDVGVANPASQAFPDPGGSAFWSCGVVGGTSASCAAVRDAGPVDGVCGPAESNRPYAFDASGFVGDYCSAGDAPLVPPAFPPRGGVTGWTCLGRSGGDDATCSASRYLGPVAVGNEVAISIGSSRAEYDVPAPIVLTVTLSRFGSGVSGVSFSVVENDLRGGSKNIVFNQFHSFVSPVPVDVLVVPLSEIPTDSYSPGNYEYVAIITSVHAGETVLGDNIAKAQVALVKKQTAAPELDLFFVAVVALFVVAIISRGK